MATESTSDGPTKYKQIPLEMFGPKAADGSLSGFFDRTAKRFKDRRFGINVHHLQIASPEVWFRFREFVHGLTEVTQQLPTLRWNVEAVFTHQKAEWAGQPFLLSPNQQLILWNLTGWRRENGCRRFRRAYITPRSLAAACWRSSG